jgi:hypothetical protein
MFQNLVCGTIFKLNSGEALNFVFSRQIDEFDRTPSFKVSPVSGFSSMVNPAAINVCLQFQFGKRSGWFF